jgi:hypothetical protein
MEINEIEKYRIKDLLKEYPIKDYFAIREELRIKLGISHSHLKRLLYLKSSSSSDWSGEQLKIASLFFMLVWFLV